MLLVGLRMFRGRGLEFMSEIKSSIIKNLDLYMQTMISDNTNAEYEKKHYQNVKAYATSLARYRNLDSKRTQIVAILHDIGRMMPDNSNRKHAAISVEIANKMLSDQKVSQKIIKDIIRDISQHSKKSRIGNPYEELLKDADSLAHQDELGYQALSRVEKVRCDLAMYNGGKLFAFSDSSQLEKESIQDKIIKIKDSLSQGDEIFFQKESIHLFRIEINKARTLIWLLNKVETKKSDTFRSLGNQLKKLYQNNAYLRQLHVFLSIIPKEEKWSPLRDFIKEQSIKEQKILNVKKWRQIFSKIKISENTIISKTDYKLSIEELLADMRELTIRANSFEMERLHKLRICAKKFKYLQEMGIIEIELIFSKALSELHEAIGDYHDTVELVNYLESEKVKKQIENTMIYENIDIEYFNQTIRKQKKEVKVAVFRVNLILSKYL